MIGTEDGFWFSTLEQPDGKVDYCFHHYGNELKKGVAETDNEIFDLFESFVGEQRIAEAQGATLH